MSLEQKPISSPFQGESALFHWLPSVANYLLAAGSLLFLAYVAVQLRNLSVAVSDRTQIAKQASKLKAYEQMVGQTANQQKELNELKQLVAKYLETQSLREETSSKLNGSKEVLERKLSSLKSGVKGRKKKQVETELARVKAEGDRQLASLKEKSQKAAQENKKVLDAIKEKLKASPPEQALPTRTKGLETKGSDKVKGH